MLVVSQRVVPDELLKPTTQKLYAANETEIALVGEVEFTLTLAGHEITAAVVVSEEVNDQILGLDWLGRHRCRWSFTQNLTEIDERTVTVYLVGAFLEGFMQPSAMSFQLDIQSMYQRRWPYCRSARCQTTGPWSHNL